MEHSSKPLTKKLALKPGQKFLVLDAPKGYEKSLGPALPDGVTMTKGGAADAIQVFVTSRNEMKAALVRAKAALNPGGMIWLTYPKGASKKFKSDINRDSIREYTSTVGLETVALIAVDDDWSAIRCKAV